MKYNPIIITVIYLLAGFIVNQMGERSIAINIIYTDGFSKVAEIRQAKLVQR